MDIIGRFRSKTELMESGCLEWRSTLHRDGYGKFWFNGKQELAHRAAYILFVGEIEDGMCVLHKCDNRKCVNTDHLYLGDSKQNSLDRTTRVRYATRKLPPVTIPQIREKYATGKFTQQQLADEYGVHQAHISKIILNKQRVLK